MKKKPILLYVNPNNSSEIKEFNLSFKKITFGVVVFLALLVFVLKYSVDFIVDFSQNSKINQLKKENIILQTELEKIGNKISTIRSSIDFLEERDDQIRAMLDLPKINEDVRQVGIGGAAPDFNNSINANELSYGEELLENLDVLERLEREVRLEKDSYQKLLTTVERRQDSLRYLPVLKPVHDAYMSSRFGNRRHPIHRRIHFHRGIDLATNRGTPVIASADGYVVSAGQNGGYGLFIAINHVYGFETYFGHLNKVYVRKGQFVKRGDKIGEVGNTGLATSSHLHYEVHYKGKALDPTKFILSDIQY
jgi:murein DD-endopeptidase MepM/ murein hydrolase activator NlpD